MTQDTHPTRGQNPQPNPCHPPHDPIDPGTPPWNCLPLPSGPETPTLPPIEPCPEPCCCPQKPGTPGTCLDDLIAEQAKQIAEADYAKVFKADLEDLLKKAKAAKQEYTKEKYIDLRDKWEKQDTAIADLIAKLVCAVPCWWCLIECEICRLLYAIRETDLRLNGDGTLTDKVYSLRDLRYWQDRNREAKQEVVDRIKAVLAAWDKLAQTIEKNLTDNAKLIEDIKKILATDSAGAIYSLFVKVLPMHLAIAPRGASSKIGAEYTSLCCCYPGTPDDCCGPDVGEPTLLQELIGPQPYIVDPDKFFDIICCLATQRYLPAKEQLAVAASDLAKTDADISRAKSDIDQKKASLAADYKANVANPINCDDYEQKGGNGPKQGSPCYPPRTPSSQTPSPQVPTVR